MSYSGGIYQNSTGGNSDPTLATDWVFIKSITPVISTAPYHVDFVADVTQKFTLPAGILAKNVFLNNVSANGESWSQAGVEVTVTSSQINDLVTITN